MLFINNFQELCFPLYMIIVLDIKKCCVEITMEMTVQYANTNVIFYIWNTARTI